jgi:hypothetical protein
MKSINICAQTKCDRYPSPLSVFEKLKEKPVKIDYRKLTPSCNLNDSIKNRLFYLLNPEWTSFEIEYSANVRLNENYEWLRIEEKAIEISKGNDSIFRVSKDSIKNYWINDYKKNMKEYNGLSSDGSIIQAVAYLDLKEAVPLLQKYYPSTDSRLIKTALARLGDKVLQKEILKSCLPDTSLNGWDWIIDLQKKGETLSFIGTQESIFIFSNWLDTTKRYYRSHHSKQKRNVANQVLLFLKPIILNEDFQGILKLTFPDVSDLYDCEYDNTFFLLRCKNWLIKNKGKYKIKRTFYEW